MYKFSVIDYQQIYTESEKFSEIGWNLNWGKCIIAFGGWATLPIGVTSLTTKPTRMNHSFYIFYLTLEALSTLISNMFICAEIQFIFRNNPTCQKAFEEHMVDDQSDKNWHDNDSKAYDQSN